MPRQETILSEAARRLSPHDRKRIYIAGKMTGIPYFNFKTFDLAKAAIEALGHIAVSPADLDRMVGFDALTLPADYNWHRVPDGFDMKAARRRDIEAIESCDAILLLDGWKESTGARAEKAYADWCGIPEFKL